MRRIISLGFFLILFSMFCETSLASQIDPDKPLRLAAVSYSRPSGNFITFPYAFSYSGRSTDFHNIYLAQEAFITGEPIYTHSPADEGILKTFWQNPSTQEFNNLRNNGCKYNHHVIRRTVNFKDLSSNPFYYAIAPQISSLQVTVNSAIVTLAKSEEGRLVPLNENVLGFTFLDSLDLAQAKMTNYPYLIVRNNNKIELMRAYRHEFYYPQISCNQVMPKKLPHRLAMEVSEEFEVAGVKGSTTHIAYTGQYFMTALFSEKAKDEIWNIYLKSLNAAKEKTARNDQQRADNKREKERIAAISNLFETRTPSMQYINEKNGFNETFYIGSDAAEHFKIPFSSIKVEISVDKSFTGNYKGQITVTAGDFKRTQTIYTSSRYYNFSIPLDGNKRISVHYTNSTAAATVARASGTITGKIIDK